MLLRRISSGPIPQVFVIESGLSGMIETCAQLLTFMDIATGGPGTLNSHAQDTCSNLPIRVLPDLQQGQGHIVQTERDGRWCRRLCA